MPKCKYLQINGLSFSYPLHDMNSVLLKRLNFFRANNETSDLTSRESESNIQVIPLSCANNYNFYIL